MRFAMRAALSAAMLASALGCGKSSDASGGDKPAQTAALEQPAKPESDCAKCRARSCAGDGANKESLDLAAGCFEKADPKFVPTPDAKFASDCKAAMDCAFKHDCAYDSAKGPVHCYCGSRAVDECVAQGPAEDAPCVAEWQAATRSQSNKEILERFSQIEYPSGWAFHLLECDRDYCGARSELGRCTP
jgi:hypothetical protein